MKARGHATYSVSRFFRALLLVAGFALLLFSSISAEISPQYRERIATLISRLKTSGLSHEELDRVFSDDRVELYPQILERKAKGLQYMSRKFGLLTRKSIDRGRRVLEDNRMLFSEIEQTYGVDKEIVIAILRIETNFSSYVGSYPIFNSLLTLAVIENRRSAWAESELVELFHIAQKLGRDPLSIRGSWAGAFGIAQFVPSSYVRFAVDGNGDGTIDLFDFSDATASIANYLKAHGWKKNQPEKNRQAVYTYNHCDNYVTAVFTYAGAIGKGASPNRHKGVSR
ncbi:MAG: Membrane-bound lytic murein transglycosylase B precursor [Syntrophorhabdus sp. PtaU1.Bin050]|jgi:membrane-bound lytic murein transglycosylase B|nr:MAG: Membrane-bound lytic murein transglycosylase B precursor [Syntrophorhabdus sp. PtaU1.Bin050]